MRLLHAHRLAWHGNTLRPPDPARIGRWKQALTPAQIQVLEQAAGEVLTMVGYALSTEVSGWDDPRS